MGMHSLQIYQLSPDYKEYEEKWHGYVNIQDVTVLQRVSEMEEHYVAIVKDQMIDKKED